jgi:hypothetical protein
MPEIQVSESDSRTPDVSVIIANYETRDLLAENLETLFASEPRCSFEVVVADDASKDGSVEMVRERFPQVTVVAIPVNGGYGPTNNAGIAAARGRYLYLLNSDAQVLPGVLDALLEFLERHPKAGAAGSLVHNEDGSVQDTAKALPSLRTAFFGKTSWIRRLFPGAASVRSEVLTTGIDETTPPFQAGYVSSASVMIPRRVFDTVGELDHSLFYWGDADYGLRIQRAGLEVWCVPSARMIHFEHRGGTSSGLGRTLWSISRFHLDAWRYYSKNSGHGRFHPATLGVGAGLLGRGVALFVLAVMRSVVGRGESG